MSLFRMLFTDLHVFYEQCKDEGCNESSSSEAESQLSSGGMVTQTRRTAHITGPWCSVINTTTMYGGSQRVYIMQTGTCVVSNSIWKSKHRAWDCSSVCLCINWHDYLKSLVTFLNNKFSLTTWIFFLLYRVLYII